MLQLIKDKFRFNLIIDILMFLLMIPVAGIGFLMKWLLPPGYLKNEIYGPSVDLEFWGLDRHQWGTIHLVLSLILLSLLLIHLIFHWKMIVCFFEKIIPSIVIRRIMYSLMFIFTAVILISPLVLTPEEVVREPHYRNRKARLHMHYQQKNDSFVDKTNNGEDQDSISNQVHGGRAAWQADDEEFGEYEVFGYMTLQSVADKYKVPASIILKDLDIPDYSADEKLGWLRKKYKFTMTDVRRSLYNYLHKK